MAALNLFSAKYDKGDVIKAFVLGHNPHISALAAKTVAARLWVAILIPYLLFSFSVIFVIMETLLC